MEWFMNLVRYGDVGLGVVRYGRVRRGAVRSGMVGQGMEWLQIKGSK